MIISIVTIHPQPGRESELERLFAELALEVRATEPGNLAYQLCRSRSEPDIYKVLEVYKSEQDLARHGTSDRFKRTGLAIRELLTGDPSLEFFDGFGTWEAKAETNR